MSCTVKTYRDVKSGLSLSRTKRVTSRTSQIEASVKKDIEGKYGNLSRFSEEVALKEEMRKNRQNLSLERSRLKLFMAKEKLSRLQQAREVSSKKSSPKQNLKQDCSPKASHESSEGPKIRRVELRY